MEKLWVTAGERDLLEMDHVGALALNVIDRLTAKCDAQAAVIERVRAVRNGRGWQGRATWQGALDEAIAAAPEHTAQALDVVPKGWRRTAAGGLCYDPEAAPEQTAPTMADLNCERDLRQARARVAELEADRKELSAVLGRTEESLVAANARADAAERDCATALDGVNQLQAVLNRTEENYHELTLDAAALRSQRNSLVDDVRHADKIIASLRAEVEQQKVRAASWERGHDYAWEQLAAANALLESLRWEPDVPAHQKAAIVAHLSASSPPERL